MGTTADKLAYLQGTKAAIKSAIINKGVAVPDGTTFRAYAEKIGDIIDVPDLSNPGSAGDLRNGKQLVGADGSIVTGTLPEVTQATPSISVSSGGLITASATQSGGIVEGGSKSATQQLTTQAAKTVTPGTTEQTAVASGRYTTGDVVVSGDANLVAENIAEGVSIFGVTGTHSGGGGPWYQQFVDYLKTEGDKYTLNNPYTTISVTGDAENYEGFYGVYFEAISTPEQSALIPWPCITLMGYQLNGFRGEWSFEGAGAYMLIDSNGHNYGFQIKDFNAVIPCYMYVFKDSIVDFAS